MQRNFESLSDFCKSEKERNQYQAIKFEELQKENERLIYKLKELNGENNKHIEIKKEEAPNPKTSKNDLEVLKQLNATLQKTIQGKTIEIENLEDNMRKVKIEKEKLNKENATLKEKLQGHNKQNKDHDQELASLKVLFI